MTAESIVITGHAHGRRATLEVAGDRLTWRANRAGVADNVATTLHDVPALALITRRWSWGGVLLAAFGAMWQLSEGGVSGLAALAVAALLLAYRLARPVRMLLLDLGSRALSMRVDAPSLADARALDDRHARVHLLPAAERATPTLP